MLTYERMIFHNEDVGTAKAFLFNSIHPSDHQLSFNNINPSLTLKFRLFFKINRIHFLYHITLTISVILSSYTTAIIFYFIGHLFAKRCVIFTRVFVRINKYLLESLSLYYLDENVCDCRLQFISLEYTPKLTRSLSFCVSLCSPFMLQNHLSSSFHSWDHYIVRFSRRTSITGQRRSSDAFQSHGPVPLVSNFPRLS